MPTTNFSIQNEADLQLLLEKIRQGEVVENEVCLRLNQFEINPHHFKRLDEKWLQSQWEKSPILPLGVEKNQHFQSLWLACPKEGLNAQALAEIRLLNHLPVQFLKADKEDIQEKLAFYLGFSFNPKNPKENIGDLNSSQQSLHQAHWISLLHSLEDEGLEGSDNAKEVVEQTLSHAVSLGASDIHFIAEPKQTTTVIFRLDGILHPIQTLNQLQSQKILAALKVMSGLNIAENQLPQDGHLTLSFQAHPIDFRLSLIPTQNGDSLVLRVLDAQKNLLNLNQLGFETHTQRRLEKLTQGAGLFLIAGQTGSGKSTTIYALIHQLKNQNLSIVTLEDPIEYQVTGVKQIAIKDDINYGFAKALRSVLRHDPDVIVIGEIRDEQTAQIALQSALTGHLVVSTVHTNSALEAVIRLSELGLATASVMASLKGVLAQKLIRKICQHCHNQNPEDCYHCLHTGYWKRTVTYELLELNDQTKPLFKKALTHQAQAEKALIEKGYQTLSAHAQSLVNQGISTNEELVRVGLAINNQGEELQP